jgi:hypothetical protein
VILNSHLETTQQELMISIEDMKVLPDHSHVMIRPDKKMRPPNSMMSGASLSKDIHQLILVDYLLLYYTDKKTMLNDLEPLNNNQTELKIRIGLISPSLWKKLNSDWLNKVMNKRD